MLPSASDAAEHNYGSIGLKGLTNATKLFKPALEPVYKSNGLAQCETSAKKQRENL